MGRDLFAEEMGSVPPTEPGTVGGKAWLLEALSSLDVVMAQGLNAWRLTLLGLCTRGGAHGAFCNTGKL